MVQDFKTRVPPPLLYRYTSPKTGRSFIDDPHLRFSNPKTFNDPFEFRPELKVRAGGAELKALLEHNLLSPRLPIEEVEVILARRIHEDAAERYHVLCFTEDPLHPLMWAHYGVSHTGFALGFDSELFTPFRELSQPAGPVIYSGTRPVIGFPSTGSEEADTITGIFTKGADWSYEQEWRIALLRKNGHPPSEQRHMSFDPNLLRLVIAGSRCSENDFAAVHKAIRANAKLRHVEMFRATPEDRGFRFRLKRKDGGACNLERFIEKFESERAQRRACGETWFAEGMRRRAAKGLPTP